MSHDAAGKFIMMLMHARTNAHILHLRSKSYAQHKALEGFYEGIVGLVDGFAEHYQGEYGFIEAYPSGYSLPAVDPVKDISDLCEGIDALRKRLPQDSPIQNIVDEISSLTSKTLYQLKFLK